MAKKSEAVLKLEQELASLRIKNQELAADNARKASEITEITIKLRREIGRANRATEKLDALAPTPDESPMFRAACQEYQKHHPGKPYTYATVRGWLAAGKPVPLETANA